jgi:iron complex transport system permease protein
VAPFYQGSASTLAETVVLQLRLPRILLALITGISLAGAGAVMQGILRNSLVSPYTLGMSGGASFFIYLLLKKRKRWWS